MSSEASKRPCIKHEQIQTFCLKWSYHKITDNSAIIIANPARARTLTMFVLRLSVAVAFQHYTVMADVFSFLLLNRHEHKSCDICHSRSLIQKKPEAHRGCDQISWREKQDGKWTQGSSCWRLELLRNSCAALSVLKTPARWTVNKTACFSKQTARVNYYFLNAGVMSDGNEWNAKLLQPTISIV